MRRGRVTGEVKGMTQRLSDSIGLGRMLVEHRRCMISGCALGMALAANGVERVWSRAEELWPWAHEVRFESSPCGCGYFSEMTLSAVDIIMHIFDSHVRGNPNLHREWTLDQLIDWVRS